MASTSGNAEVEEKRCTNCTEAINSVYTECSACVEDEVNLCLQCFSLGAECGDHRRTHDYRVRCPGGMPVFSPQNDTRNVWTAAEEIRLIEAAEKFNMGNWEDVTRIVNSKRAVNEAREHYDQYYLRGRIGQHATSGFSRPTAVDHTIGTEVAGQNGLSSPPIRNSVHKISYDDLRLLAYMPHRDDFEKEWNNDAETLVSKLLPAPDDDYLDKAVKLAHVDMYVRIAAERRKRKALARDYDLVPQFFKREKPAIAGKAWQYTPQMYQKMKRETDLKEQMRKFAQLMSAADFNEIVDNLAKQDLLKERIEELQKYRKNGVTTLEEGANLEELEREWRLSVAKTPSVFDPSLPPQAGGSSIWTAQPTEKSVEPKSRSDSIVKTEKPTIAGTDSEDGKRSWQSQTDDKSSILCSSEIKFCAERCVEASDYMALKVGVLREELQRAQGAPFRPNPKTEPQDLKSAVRSLMLNSGWLPCLSTFLALILLSSPFQ